MVSKMKEGRCALSPIPEEEKITGINCHIAGRVPELREARSIPRELRRTMSPMTIFAYLATREALAQAGFSSDSLPRTGVSIGSTMGSGQELLSLFSSFIPTGNLDTIRTMTFFKIMAHTTSSGIAIAFGLNGRIINPVAACAAGLQGIGLAYETIAFGREDRMICGGAEEYSPLTSATFDKIGAASHTDNAETSSLPFDRRRSGIVCSEGAGILFLEEREHALARGASILAEIVGFSSLSSPTSVASPDAETSASCMKEALTDAGADMQDVVYVNAHATATVSGDQAEGKAIEKLWGDTVPTSSLKEYLGHSLAASGALETAACIAMMQSGTLLSHRSSFQPDPACGAIQYVQPDQTLPRGLIVKNSFALGGIYSSLVLAPAR